jgi:hypothetical protein
VARTALARIVAVIAALAVAICATAAMGAKPKGPPANVPASAVVRAGPANAGAPSVEMRFRLFPAVVAKAPRQTSRILISLTSGFTVNTAKFPQCDPKTLATGAKCPLPTKLAIGGGVLDAADPYATGTAAHVAVPAKLTLYNGAPRSSVRTLLLLVEIFTPIAQRAVLPVSIVPATAPYGLSLAIDTTQLPRLGGFTTTFKSLELRTSRKGIISAPKACPSSNWPIQVRFEYSQPLTASAPAPSLVTRSIDCH